eukprot:TRINITY_DN93400_c0_g1_i1.p1 TRINITY_DN93400_c0_g1~~TRINITY_DN93400_c0_g1_i1.p1  ORF type:complete len:213 (+),score=25.72 TRINITY_DN93400_c0_g1_i1:165-803(+)
MEACDTQAIRIEADDTSLQSTTAAAPFMRNIQGAEVLKVRPQKYWLSGREYGDGLNVNPDMQQVCDEALMTGFSALAPAEQEVRDRSGIDSSLQLVDGDIVSPESCAGGKVFSGVLQPHEVPEVNENVTLPGVQGPMRQVLRHRHVETDDSPRETGRARDASRYPLLPPGRGPQIAPGVIQPRDVDNFCLEDLGELGTAPPQRLELLSNRYY